MYVQTSIILCIAFYYYFIIKYICKAHFRDAANALKQYSSLQCYVSKSVVIV